MWSYRNHNVYPSTNRPVKATPPLVQCTEAGMLRSYNGWLICLTTALRKFLAMSFIKHNLQHDDKLYILHINLQLSVLFDLRWLPSQSTWWNDLSRPRCVRLLYNIWQCFENQPTLSVYRFIHLFDFFHFTLCVLSWNLIFSRIFWLGTGNQTM